MNENTNTNTNTGVGFTGLLTLLFVGLKLTHFIDWSWWWVLCPIWFWVALILLILLGAFIWVVIKDKIDNHILKKQIKAFKKDNKVD